MRSHGSAIPSRTPAAPADWMLLVVIALPLLAGCVNTLAIASKVFVGDPKQPSAFQQVTGESLSESKKKVLVYCSAAPILTEDFGAVASDLQDELIPRMRRHEIDVLPPDTGVRVIDRIGRFDAEALGQELEDVDYIMHIHIDAFSLTVPNSPDLYHCQSHGTVTGFEVRKDEDGGKTVFQIFERNFENEYPSNHPVSREQVSRNVFYHRAIDFMADTVGTSFYDVPMSALYAR